MNFSTASRTYQLLTRIFDVRNVTEPFLPSAAEKRHFPSGTLSSPFPGLHRNLRAYPLTISADFWKN